LTQDFKCLVIVLYCLIFFSCKKVEPGGFWTGFEKDHIVKNNNDQGPWGGCRSLYWKSDVSNKFTSPSLISYANKNGWQLIDSFELSADALSTWRGKDPTFPFTYTDFLDSTMMITAFPRWIETDVTLYRFKTGWIVVEPGNLRETDTNGYIILSKDGKQLSVYHLWGE